MGLRGSSDLELAALVINAGGNASEFDVRSITLPATSQRIELEFDKFAQFDFVAPVTRAGVESSIGSIYSPLGFEVSVSERTGDIRDLLSGRCYTDAELDGLAAAYPPTVPAMPDATWRVQGLLVSCHVEGLLGLMFRGAGRDAFAVFLGAPDLADKDKVLRTTIHELGHALCFEHYDGDGWGRNGAAANAGRTIMNQTWSLATDWGFSWFAPEAHLVMDTSRSNWAPGQLPFGSCR